LPGGYKHLKRSGTSSGDCISRPREYAPYRRARMPEMKMIGKPYVGELQVRFDEGEQAYISRQFLNGHEAENGGYSQGLT